MRRLRTRLSVDESSEPLVERAKRGDVDAWEALYVNLYPRLLSYATRRLDPHAARDVVNETMTRAVARIERFRPDGVFDAWVFGICRNVVMEDLRASQRRSEPFEDGPADSRDPADEVAASAEHEAVRAAFLELSPADQELLELRVVGGLSAEAVAQALGKRPGAVRMAQSRALDRLRSILEESEVSA